MPRTRYRQLTLTTTDGRGRTVIEEQFSATARAVAAAHADSEDPNYGQERGRLRERPTARITFRDMDGALQSCTFLCSREIYIGEARADERRGQAHLAFKTGLALLGFELQTLELISTHAHSL